jgi:hypothetical protein
MNEDKATMRPDLSDDVKMSKAANTPIFTFEDLRVSFYLHQDISKLMAKAPLAVSPNCIVHLVGGMCCHRRDFGMDLLHTKR